MMTTQYWIRWLPDYGWACWIGARHGRWHPISGWRSFDINHFLTWCGSVDVTILPAHDGGRR